MFERYTDRARKAMAMANQEAQRFNHEYLGGEHLLLGIVKEGTGIAARALAELGVDPKKARLEVEKLIRPGPEMVTMGKLPMTPRLKRILELAAVAAKGRGENYVGTEHLLLGMLVEPDGIAGQVLAQLNVTADRFTATLQTVAHDRPPLTAPPSPPSPPPPAPQATCTKGAGAGAPDTVWDRDAFRPREPDTVWDYGALTPWELQTLLDLIRKCRKGGVKPS